MHVYVFLKGCPCINVFVFSLFTSRRKASHLAMTHHPLFGGKFLEIFAWNNLFLAHPFPHYNYFSKI